MHILSFILFLIIKTTCSWGGYPLCQGGGSNGVGGKKRDAKSTLKVKCLKGLLLKTTNIWGVSRGYQHRTSY